MTKPSVPIYGGIISTKSSVRAVSEVDGNVPPGHDTGAETPVTNRALQSGPEIHYAMQASTLMAAVVLYFKGKYFRNACGESGYGCCHKLRLQCS